MQALPLCVRGWQGQTVAAPAVSRPVIHAARPPVHMSTTTHVRPCARRCQGAGRTEDGGSLWAVLCSPGPPFVKQTATSVARRQRCGHVGRWPRRVGNRAVDAVPRHCLSLPAPPPMSPGLHGATSIPPPLSPGLHLSLPAPPPVFLAGRARAVAAAVSRVPN